jgi:hypothetical protein
MNPRGSSPSGEISEQELVGKSQLTAFTAATISNGGDWPCNEGATAAGSVIS